MEINSHNISRAHLINELIRGIELARQLRAQMGPEYSPQIKNNLLEQILSSYDKALFILRCGALSEQPHQLALATSPPLPSSLKRKSASTWTNKVKMNPEDGLDGPPNDGYSWRKYGQKDILGSKNPRSYYKCTYRSVQDCWATRQVQRSDEDPTIVEITYRGKHTCNEVRRSKSAPTLPAKQEPKQDLSIDEYQEADLQNMDSFPSAGLGIFANVQHQLQFLEGGIGDVVLGATSSINSPAITPEDFMLDEGFFS